MRRRNRHVAPGRRRAGVSRRRAPARRSSCAGDQTAVRPPTAPRRPPVCRSRCSRREGWSGGSHSHATCPPWTRAHGRSAGCSAAERAHWPKASPLSCLRRFGPGDRGIGVGTRIVPPRCKRCPCPETPRASLDRAVQQMDREGGRDPAEEVLDRHPVPRTSALPAPCAHRRTGEDGVDDEVPGSHEEGAEKRQDDDVRASPGVPTGQPPRTRLTTR